MSQKSTSELHTPTRLADVPVSQRTALSQLLAAPAQAWAGGRIIRQEVLP